MATCVPTITDDLLFDCDNRDVQGIEADVILINRDDIDFGASTINATNSKILDVLQLKSGKTGYKLQGIKLLNSYLSEVVVNAEGLNRWRHNFNGRVFNLTSAARKQIDLIADGAQLVAVVERKWKGAAGDATFIVLGFGTGLYIAEGAENSNENDGSFVFRVASDDNALEGEGPKTLLMTNYATTKTAFDAQFIQA